MKRLALWVAAALAIAAATTLWLQLDGSSDEAPGGAAGASRTPDAPRPPDAPTAPDGGATRTAAAPEAASPKDGAPEDARAIRAPNAEGARIEGRVVDREGAPLRARVQLLAIEGALLRD